MIYIEDCISTYENILEIKTDKIIEYNKKDIKKYELLAKTISRETSIPIEYIYNRLTDKFYLNRWFKVNNEWLNFKDNKYYQYIINELLGEKISEYFDLETIHYRIGKLIINGKCDKYGIISKSFCDKKYEYLTLDEYFSKIQKKDLNIIKEINKVTNNKKECLNLTNDLKKMFIRDFYTGQRDRIYFNMILKKTNKGIRLGPLFDYEYSFNPIDPSIYRSSLCKISLYDKNTCDLLRNDKKFQELIQKIMNINLKNIIEDIEDSQKIIIPTKDKSLYNIHDREVKKTSKGKEINKIIVFYKKIYVCYTYYNLDRRIL